MNSRVSLAAVGLAEVDGHGLVQIDYVAAKPEHYGGKGNVNRFRLGLHQANYTTQ